VPLGADLEARDDMFSYEVHAKRNSKKLMCPFSRAELKKRLGTLDVAFLSREISMSSEAVKEHATRCDSAAISAESEHLEQWREGVNGYLTLFQKRTALAFLGLPPETDELEIHKKYKKLALELHPDKGGDHAKFKELQQMKARLIEPKAGDDDSDDDGGGDIDEDGNIETETESEDGMRKTRKRKQKRKRKKDPGLEDKDEGSAAKRQRKEMHDCMVRCWESSQNSRAEMGDSHDAPDPQVAMNMLRMFIDRFVASEIDPVKDMDNKVAEAKLQKFVKQGAEIIAVAAAVDMEAALSTLALHFNCRLLSRNCSEALKAKCAVLLEAAAWVQVQVGDFLSDFAAARAQEKAERAREAEARNQAETAAVDEAPTAAETPADQDKSGPTPTRRVRVKMKTKTASPPPDERASGPEKQCPTAADSVPAGSQKKTFSRSAPNPTGEGSAPASTRKAPSQPAEGRPLASSVRARPTTSTIPEGGHTDAESTKLHAATGLVRIKSVSRPAKAKAAKAKAASTNRSKPVAEQANEAVGGDTSGLDAAGENDAEAVAMTASTSKPPAGGTDVSNEEKMLRRTERWLERLAERDQKQREKEKLREQANMEKKMNQWARKWCSRTKVEVQPRGGA